MVTSTGSKLSWAHCNKTQNYNNIFDPTRSTSYSLILCSLSTCTNLTRDFTIPASCNSNKLCHATLSYTDATNRNSGLVFGCRDSTYPAGFPQR
ncbi:hypothetical protein ACFX2J_034382 [Malus domestica]